MSGWTKRNLVADVEDQAPGFGFGDVLQARFAHDALGLGDLGVSLQRIAPSQRAPFAHRHDEAEELYVVLAGGGQALLGEEVVPLAAHDALRVAPATVRSFAAGPDGLELLAVSRRAPGDGKPEPARWPAG